VISEGLIRLACLYWRMIQLSIAALRAGFRSGVPSGPLRG
jgi:hypothetical protein